MVMPRYDETEFIAKVLAARTWREAAIAVDTTERQVICRAKRVEERNGYEVRPIGASFDIPRHESEVLSFKSDRQLLFGSDLHKYPDSPLPYPARVFLEVVGQLEKPVVFLNGDFFDFASISRFRRNTWRDYRPELKDELAAGLEFFRKVQEANKKAELHFVPGNHDDRFEIRLAIHAPEFEGVPGASLADHIKRLSRRWHINESVFIWRKSRDEPLAQVIHTDKGGKYAAYRNALEAGITIFTGHSHRGKVEPIRDFRGIRYGVETGTLSDPYDEAFGYVGGRSRNWHPSFIYAEYSAKHDQITPRVIHCERGQAEFMGKKYPV